LRRNGFDAALRALAGIGHMIQVNAWRRIPR
jgi:hypothetical protein